MCACMRQRICKVSLQSHKSRETHLDEMQLLQLLTPVTDRLTFVLRTMLQEIPLRYLLCPLAAAASCHSCVLIRRQRPPAVSLVSSHAGSTIAHVSEV